MWVDEAETRGRDRQDREEERMGLRKERVGEEAMGSKVGPWTRTAATAPAHGARPKRVRALGNVARPMSAQHPNPAMPAHRRAYKVLSRAMARHVDPIHGTAHRRPSPCHDQPRAIG